MAKSTPAANPDAYIRALTGWRRACVEGLRNATRRAAPLEETIKWGHLVYLSGGPVLYIRAEAQRILFGFWRGQRLMGIEPRLKPGGKYEMATIELKPGDAVTPATVRRLVKEAVTLNQTVGNPIDDAKPHAKKKAVANAATKIRFHATLHRPAGTAPGGSSPWTFLNLPKHASEKLPARGMVTVKGTINGAPLQATLQPDGQGGHWLKVDRKLREAAGAAPGDTITLEIEPVAPDDEPEPAVPPDLKKALAAASGAPGAKAREIWADITPLARRDWIQWITSGKRAETRVKRIEAACDMLAKGKRRPCCFDRSGMYDKSLSCPVAADP